MKTYKQFMEQFSGREIGKTNALASETISARKENEQAAEQRRNEAEQKRAEREREADKRKAEAERAAEKRMQESEVIEAVVKKSPYTSKAVGSLLRKAKVPTTKSMNTSISDAGRISRARTLAPLGTTRTLMRPLQRKPFNPIKSAVQATKSALKKKATGTLRTAVGAIKDKLGI